MGAEDQEGALEEAARGLLDKEGLWARDHSPLQDLVLDGGTTGPQGM